MYVRTYQCIFKHQKQKLYLFVFGKNTVYEDLWLVVIRTIQYFLNSTKIDKYRIVYIVGREGGKMKEFHGSVAIAPQPLACGEINA